MTRTPSRQLLTRVHARVVQDAWIEGWTATWQRRAEAFEAARSRPGDYPGQATSAELAAADRRCAAIAQACRSRATGLDGYATAELGATLTALAGEAA